MALTFTAHSLHVKQDMEKKWNRRAIHFMFGAVETTYFAVVSGVDPLLL